MFIVNFIYFKIIEDLKKIQIFVICLQHYVLSVFRIMIQDEWIFLELPIVAMVIIPGE